MACTHPHLSLLIAQRMRDQWPQLIQVTDDAVYAANAAVSARTLTIYPSEADYVAYLEQCVDCPCLVIERHDLDVCVTGDATALDVLAKLPLFKRLISG